MNTQKKFFLVKNIEREKNEFKSNLQNISFNYSYSFSGTMNNKGKSV